MDELLQQLTEGQPLSEEQAEQAFGWLMGGQLSEIRTAALLSLLAVRPPTVDELAGAARIMRKRARSVEPPAGLRVLDTCGTGGDQSGTFNISTAAALVTAGAGREAGVAVAKHGNRSISSSSGSSQVLETLGVKVGVAEETLQRCMSEAGICFCFAPSHHPAMKHAAPVRKELGFRTIFNVLGPLTNPAGADRQLIGVYSSKMTRSLAEALQRLGAQRAMVVHGQIPDPDGLHIDGLDELSTCGPSRVAELTGRSVRTFGVDPGDLNLAFSHPTALRADSPERSAAMIEKVLNGEPGAAREIVGLNAAAALVVAELAGDLSEGLERAFAAIDSGQARAALDTLAGLTTADPTRAG